MSESSILENHFKGTPLEDLSDAYRKLCDVTRGNIDNIIKNIQDNTSIRSVVLETTGNTKRYTLPINDPDKYYKISNISFNNNSVEKVALFVHACRVAQCSHEYFDINKKLFGGVLPDYKIGGREVVIIEVEFVNNNENSVVLTYELSEDYGQYSIVHLSDYIYDINHMRGKIKYLAVKNYPKDFIAIACKMDDINALISYADNKNHEKIDDCLLIDMQGLNFSKIYKPEIYFILADGETVSINDCHNIIHTVQINIVQRLNGMSCIVFV